MCTLTAPARAPRRPWGAPGAFRLCDRDAIGYPRTSRGRRTIDPRIAILEELPVSIASRPRLRAFATLAIAALAALSTLARAADPVELQLLFPIAVGGPLTQIMDKLVARYHDTHPGVAVKAIYSGTYDETMTKARAQFKAGQPPDVLIASAVELFNLRDLDMIVAYEDALKGTDTAWTKRFYEAFMVNSTQDGKTWGLPFQRSTIIQYYNKDAFRKAGLDPDHPPKTWEELRDMSLKLRDAGGVKFGFQIPSDNFGDWLFAALCWQNGLALVSPDGKHAYFNDPRAVEALQYWVDLGKAGAVPKGSVSWATTPKDFVEGKVAIMWTTTGNLTNVRKQAKFDFGVSPLPAHRQPGSPTGGANLYVFKTGDAAKERAAAEFAKWMSDPEQAAEWSIATGYVGSSEAAYDTPAMKAYVASFPAAVVARDQLAHYTRSLGLHGNGRATAALSDAIQAALTGTKSPKEALDGAQKTADGVLARYQR
jgi:sn-glycerol 3-phosphate transport system substrate-binding protein